MQILQLIVLHLNIHIRWVLTLLMIVYLVKQGTIALQEVMSQLIVLQALTVLKDQQLLLNVQ